MSTAHVDERTRETESGDPGRQAVGAALLVTWK